MSCKIASGGAFPEVYLMDEIAEGCELSPILIHL